MYKFTAVLCFIIFISINTVFAQTERGLTDQGRVLVGTSAGFSITSVKIEDVDDNLTNITLNTSGGYFIIDNLALNLNFEYDYVKFGSESENSFSVGLTARYYTPPKVFVGSGYLVSIPDEGDSSGFIPIELGYAYFLNRNVALEPAFGLLIGIDNSVTTAYVFNIGIGIYLR